MRVIYRWFLCGFIVCLVAGCGASDKPVEVNLDLVPVRGVVTLDNQPLADADITFRFDGTPPKGFIAGGAKSDSSGKFIVMTGSKPGAMPGRYKITVSRLRMADGSPVKIDKDSGMDMEMLRMGGQLKDSVPARYSDAENTEL